MTMLGLLTGMVQAYIFSILAAVYIAAAHAHRRPSLRRARNLKACEPNKGHPMDSMNLDRRCLDRHRRPYHRLRLHGCPRWAKAGRSRLP
jgi:hypothetical protein